MIDLTHYGLIGARSAKQPKIVHELEKRNYTEQTIQTQLCQWMKLQYPNVIFHVDAGSAKKRSFIEQNIHKKQQFAPGIPDFSIYKPNRGYYGLFIELKKDRAALYTTKGLYRNTEHINDQIRFIELLRAEGYKAEFACGFEEAKQIITEYLK